MKPQQENALGVDGGQLLSLREHIISMLYAGTKSIGMASGSGKNISLGGGQSEMQREGHFGSYLSESY